MQQKFQWLFDENKAIQTAGQDKASHKEGRVHAQR